MCAASDEACVEAQRVAEMVKRPLTRPLQLTRRLVPVVLGVRIDLCNEPIPGASKLSHGQIFHVGILADTVLPAEGQSRGTTPDDAAAMSPTAAYGLICMPYADVNGIHLYYEERGEGPPLVLLHGGVLTIELSFGVVIPVLAEHHRVIAVELQGHGRTADIDRPMTFEHFAADVVALLDHLGIESADVFGFSLGGLTAYELLVHHPGRVRRAVVASADYRNDRLGEIDAERLPTEEDFAAMRDAYTAVAPDPTHFEEFMKRLEVLVHGFDGWTDDDLRGIAVPVLVLIGDTDFILVPNAVEAVELLPQGRLAVLPATTHMHMTRSELVAPIVESFLAG